MRAAPSFFATDPSGARLLTIEIVPDGDVVTVRAAGDVDALTGRTFEEALTAALATGPARLIVDLTAVAYFSVSSLAILHRVRRVSAVAGALEVVTRPGIVERVVSRLARPAVAA